MFDVDDSIPMSLVRKSVCCGSNYVDDSTSIQSTERVVFKAWVQQNRSVKLIKLDKWAFCTQKVGTRKRLLLEGYSDLYPTCTQNTEGVGTAQIQ